MAEKLKTTPSQEYLKDILAYHLVLALDPLPTSETQQLFERINKSDKTKVNKLANMIKKLLETTDATEKKLLANKIYTSGLDDLIYLAGFSNEISHRVINHIAGVKTENLKQ